MHDSWLTPPCLAELKRTLGPKTPGWPRKKLLHWPSYSCNAPFRLELSQTYSVELYKSSSSAWFWWWKSLTYLIWRKRSGRGLGKTLWSPLLQQEPPHQEKLPPKEESHWRWPEQRSLPTLFHWTHHLCPNKKGQCLLRNWPWCPEGGHHHHLCFLPGSQRTSPHHLRGHIPAWNYYYVWPLCIRVTGDDHLPHPSDGQSPLFPSGSEPYQDIPTEHIFLEAPGTLPKYWRTLSNYNTLWHHGNTSPEHWLEQIPTLPTKWTLELRIYLLSWQSEF